MPRIGLYHGAYANPRDRMTQALYSESSTAQAKKTRYGMISCSHSHPEHVYAMLLLLVPCLQSTITETDQWNKCCTSGLLIFSF